MMPGGQAVKILPENPAVREGLRAMLIGAPGSVDGRIFGCRQRLDGRTVIASEQWGRGRDDAFV
jgi:hypothetical protein